MGAVSIPDVVDSRKKSVHVERAFGEGGNASGDMLVAHIVEAGVELWGMSVQDSIVNESIELLVSQFYATGVVDGLDGGEKVPIPGLAE